MRAWNGLGTIRIAMVMFLFCAPAGCSDGGTSAESSCSDGIKNGTETDVDCGGPSCGGCAVTKACAMDTDCASVACDANQCVVAPPVVSVLPPQFDAATSFAAGTQPFSVAVGDFNGDNKPDLAVANAGSNNVSVLLGNGLGGFGAATNFAAGTNPQSVGVGDFNGDNKPDLAVANAGSNNVSVLLGNGMGGFGAATNFAAGTGPISVAVGDFNGDNKPDLAVANPNSNNVSVLRNVSS